MFIIDEKKKVDYKKLREQVKRNLEYLTDHYWRFSVYELKILDKIIKDFFSKTGF